MDGRWRTDGGGYCLHARAVIFARSCSCRTRFGRSVDPQVSLALLHCFGAAPLSLFRGYGTPSIHPREVGNEPSAGRGCNRARRGCACALMLAHPLASDPLALCEPTPKKLIRPPLCSGRERESHQRGRGGNVRSVWKRASDLVKWFV